MIIIMQHIYTENIPLYIASYYVTGEGYALLPNVDMCNGCSGKSMERCSQRTVCLGAAEYYPGCALIRDLQGDHQLKL